MTSINMNIVLHKRIANKSGLSSSILCKTTTAVNYTYLERFTKLCMKNAVTYIKHFKFVMVLVIVYWGAFAILLAI